MAKKKKASERFFSIMYVPDQDKDPRSFSLNYLQGRLIAALLVFVALHFILGHVSYYMNYRMYKQKAALEKEKAMLEVSNSRIAQIQIEHDEMKAIVDKIRKGFGNTLGLDEDVSQALNDIPVDYTAREDLPSAIEFPSDSKETGASSTNYFLFSRDQNYYDPEYMPTRLPVEGYLTTHFLKSNWYHHRSHQGIDIAAEKGATVHAAGSGHVVLANWTPDFGHVIIVSHGNGYFSYYGHAMRLLVSQGIFVTKGQQIALLGSSGISSAPHLHFEIWKDGQAIDPETIILASRDKKQTES